MDERSYFFPFDFMGSAVVGRRVANAQHTAHHVAIRSRDGVRGRGRLTSARQRRWVTRPPHLGRSLAVAPIRCMGHWNRSCRRGQHPLARPTNRIPLLAVLMSPVRFNVVWLVAVVVFLSITATFNVLIDPYMLFAMPRLDGLNTRKPTASSHSAMIKAYQIERVVP